MGILNYTTKISAERTIAEIQQILVKHGATKIMVDYEDGKPSAVQFGLKLNNQLVGYKLPCNYTGVQQAMERDKSIRRDYKTEERAIWVSWRIVKDWVEAQMAIVEAGLALLPEVFLPYAVMKSGNTLFQHIKTEEGLKLIEQ